MSMGLAPLLGKNLVRRHHSISVGCTLDAEGAARVLSVPPCEGLVSP